MRLLLLTLVLACTACDQVLFTSDSKSTSTPPPATPSPAAATPAPTPKPGAWMWATPHGKLEPSGKIGTHGKK